MILSALHQLQVHEVDIGITSSDRDNNLAPTARSGRGWDDCFEDDLGYADERFGNHDGLDDRLRYPYVGWNESESVQEHDISRAIRKGGWNVDGFSLPKAFGKKLPAAPVFFYHGTDDGIACSGTYAGAGATSAAGARSKAGGAS